MAPPGKATFPFALPVIALVGSLIAVWFFSPNGVIHVFSRHDIRAHGGSAFVLTWLGMVGLWLVRPDGKRLEWICALTVFVLGVGLEFVQIFTRIDPSLGDVLIDGLGIALGWSSWRWVRPWFDRQRSLRKAPLEKEEEA